MRSSTPSWLTIAAINLLLPLGILLFAKGFFPYKPFLPGLAVFSDEDSPLPRPFDKVVFMVVDALRSDFVYGERSGFGFTQSLITGGQAIPFTAHATSPTITMPRVKAITTGSIPGFLDVILNFAESDTSSSLATQDNWLAQIRAGGGKLVMYGDDTWLKLFPGMFIRSEGTTSFFVSDFTEVDNNVTRHIDDELARDDWDAMVLHFLGLDHIGHKSGPQSAFMLPKQTEMDGIVERIYTAITTQPHLSSTLFVLAGDHGMNDAGNHGGSGPGETSPALVFMSPKLESVKEEIISGAKRVAPTVPKGGEFEFYDTVEQSDVAPTITTLLGLPVPRNNLGVFIPDFLQLWNSNDRVEVTMRNARQLRALVDAAYPEFERLVQTAPTSSSSDEPNFDAPSKKNNYHCNGYTSDVEELACLWRIANSMYKNWTNRENISISVESSGKTHELISEICLRTQNMLSGVASDYDMKSMVAGIVVMAVASVLAVVMVVPAMGESVLADLAFSAVGLLYGVMMFASSFVEEEHHFWYWVASGWFAALFFKERRRQKSGLGVVFIIAMLRVVRRWNQTGQKHAGAPDIVKTYFPEHTTILWILIIATYSDVFLRLTQNSFRRGGASVAWAFAFTTVGSAFGFKLSYAAYDAEELVPWWLKAGANALSELPLVNQARSVFMLVGVSMVYTYICELNVAGNDGNHAVSALGDLTDVFLLTQTRFANTPLLLLFRLMSRILSSLDTLTASEITLTTLILQHVSFFAFGGANAISSIDLSNAYNGVAGYNVLVVGFLTMVSNWVGPVFWASAAPVLLSKRGGGAAWKNHVVATTAFYAVAGLAVMAACTALRTHLFIWTVFSPKYLYLMTWCLGFHVVVSVGWGSFMARVCRAGGGR